MLPASPLVAAPRGNRAAWAGNIDPGRRGKAVRVALGGSRGFVAEGFVLMETAGDDGATAGDCDDSCVFCALGRFEAESGCNVEFDVYRSILVVGLALTLCR